MKVAQLAEKDRVKLLEIQSTARELARERGKQISTIADAFVAVGLFNKELQRLSKEYEARSNSAYKRLGLFGDVRIQVAGIDAKTGQVLIREDGEEGLSYEELRARYDEALAKAQEDQGTSSAVVPPDGATAGADLETVGAGQDL